MKQVDVLQDQRKLDALQQEIQIYRKIKHKHIVKYYGTAQGNYSLSIFVEYAKGGTIKKLISEKVVLCEKVVSKFSHQILQGLVYLHENGIMHRDIKCANILLDDHGNCKLADFGISKFSESLRSMSGGATDCGTPNWMSPETISEGKYGWKSDIWSFGCTVLEMLNGEPPYSQITNRHTVMFKIVQEGIVTSFPPNTTEDCVVFTKACLQKDPKERPSAKDLLSHEFILVNHGVGTL